MHPAGAQPFKGIEGLRAWLAWTVVIGHLAAYSPYSSYGVAKALTKAGDFAVVVFIIVSGFVITNLITIKREHYLTYITRRALRIYPAYLIGLLMGVLVATNSIDISGFWAMQPHQLAAFQEQDRQLQSNALTHLGLHLSLLHAMVPNEILPQAEHMFLSPAWSLSLEWQFYLIAPIFIYAIRRFPAATATFAILGLISYKSHLFGHYFRGGLILSSSWYFLIGIATRLHLHTLPQFEKFPLWLLIAAVPIALLSKAALIPLLIWFALILYLQSPTRWAVLDSKFARAAGDRSYSVYILHMPILLTATWCTWAGMTAQRWEAVLAASTATIVLTFAAAEIIYRYVERPAIRWGKMINFVRRRPAPIADAA